MNGIVKRRCVSECLKDDSDAGAPVPASVPGDFVICLGPDDVPETFDVRTVELLLTWLEWVEVEVRGFDDLVEELHRLRGAVMVAGTVVGVG